MPLFRQPSSTRSFPRRLVAPLCAVVATAALAAPSASASFPSAGSRVGGTAASSRQADTAHAVSPTVTALAIPGVAGASGRDLATLSTNPPSDAGHLVAHVRRPVAGGFSMVAVTWAPTRTLARLSVQVRTRYEGSWSGWTELGADGDGPSTAEDGTVRAGTSPFWVDQATAVEVAVYGTGTPTPANLEVDTIDPGTSPSDSAIGTAMRGSARHKGTGTTTGTFPAIPTIVTRAEWGADESLGSKCWDPRYGTRFDAAIVHHTAGSNDYSKNEAASVVRGVLAYHTVSRGWCDIGYNFLIDRFGTVYEGRAGGIRRSVRGAHAGDYNVNTTGISLMGNFDVASPTRLMKRSLVKLIAWRLGTAYHGAYGQVFLYDGKFNRISGHRDVMQTACPGRYVYAWLPTLRERVQARLGDFESTIEAAWRAYGGRGSDLGPVRVGERGENAGHHTTFAGGRMYSSVSGVHTLYPGPVLQKYLASGETGGDLGYPVTDVRETAGAGRAANFEGGRIYWSQASDSHVLRRGSVLKRYLDDGGVGGVLGFPVTGVYDTVTGARAGFQGGVITYDAATGTTTVTPR